LINPPSKIVKREVMASGQWLELVKTHWTQANGDIHQWEGVRRIGKFGVVMIIPRLIPSGDFILVEQFRPPLGEQTLEFPAGLIDANESFEEAALRELREETGYHGVITQTLAPRSMSPGIGSECAAIVCIDINEHDPANTNPSPQLETCEEGLITHRLNRNQMLDTLGHTNFQGANIEAKLTCFILGWALANRD